MSKFICKVCGEKEPCVLEMVNDQDGFRPMCCPVDNQSGINADWHEVTTDCSQFPKLTAEVFDRPDCPAWAKYAAVDANGDAFYYEDKPRACEADREWLVDKCIVGTSRIITGDFDPSDWQNSLIERPEKKETLPEWCKVGEWVYDCPDGYYYKVKSIDLESDMIQVADEENEYTRTVKEITTDFCQARLRPYNADEMRGLVGKVIEKGPGMHIVTGFENVFDNECMVHVNGCLYSANDLLRQFTIDGSPCGKLEHLENGEWVE